MSEVSVDRSVPSLVSPMSGELSKVPGESFVSYEKSDVKLLRNNQRTSNTDSLTTYKEMKINSRILTQTEKFFGLIILMTFFFFFRELLNKYYNNFVSVQNNLVYTNTTLRPQLFLLYLITYYR